jgi:hypothetical protein
MFIIRRRILISVGSARHDYYYTTAPRVSFGWGPPGGADVFETADQACHYIESCPWRPGLDLDVVDQAGAMLDYAARNAARAAGS